MRGYLNRDQIFYVFCLVLFCASVADFSPAVSCPELCENFEIDLVKCSAEDVYSPAVGYMNCHCDYACRAFEDCCSDFESFCVENHNASFESEIVYSELHGLPITETEGESGDDWKTRMECKTDENLNNRFYFVGTCPNAGSDAAWSGDGLESFTADMCQVIPDGEGMLRTMPVVHAQSGVTFRNSYCAVCNGISLKEVRLWDVAYYCPVGLLPNTPRPLDRNVAENIREQWETMSRYCDAVYRVNAETGVYVRNCYTDSETMADTTNCGEPIDFFHLTNNTNLLQLESDFANDVPWNQSELGERYHIQLLPEERMKMYEGYTSKMYENDVCQMLPLSSLCWTINKIPTCVQSLSHRVFKSFDFEIRTEPEGCEFPPGNHALTIGYFVGWILSFIFFLVLIILKRSAMSDRKSSSFETNAVIVIIFIWFKQGFHLLKFFTACSNLGPFIHFCMDSAFMWTFVMGYDLQLERRDLMPPFLYMMTSWVAPLLVALVGAVISLGRFGLYWLYTSTNVCWFTPLYWEIPFILGPVGVNLYTLAMTIVNITSGHMSNPHQVKYVVMFPLLLLEYILTMVPAYIDSEMLLVVAMFFNSYWALIVGTVYFLLSINDKYLEN